MKVWSIAVAGILAKSGLLSEEELVVLHNLNFEEKVLLDMADDIEKRTLAMTMEAEKTGVGELLPFFARLSQPRVCESPVARPQRHYGNGLACDIQCHRVCRSPRLQDASTAGYFTGAA